MFSRCYRELVQLVERRSPKPDVVSSSLTFPATENSRFSLIFQRLNRFFMWSIIIVINVGDEY